MWMWRIIGAIAFVLGAIGLVLPIWPTTVFWILAAFAFARSNPAWRDWIYARPGIGPAVKDFNERGVLKRRAKIAALLGMTASGVVIGYVAQGRPVTLWIALGALLIGALFVVTRPES